MKPTGTTSPSRQRGVTFPVDEVTPPTMPRRTISAGEAINALSEGESALANSADRAELLAGVGFHPLIAAVHIAFSEHRPLMLSPDTVWLTIAQGLAAHIALHSEELRARLVDHAGKASIMVATDGSTDWEDIFASFASGLRASAGDEICDLIVPDFSTTGPVEQAAGHLVLMDALEPYHDYTMMCICGIPAVTLEGTPSDWSKIRRRAQQLRRFDLGWWVDALDPICEQLELAAQGNPDTRFWRRMYKLKERYGGHDMNGWIAQLLPYLRGSGGQLNHRNPIVEDPSVDIPVSAEVLPTGLSCVPLHVTDQSGDPKDPLELLGGLVGVTQHNTTLAVRPLVGWAVRQAKGASVAARRLRADHGAPPPLHPSEVEKRLRKALPHGIPADLHSLYNGCDGSPLPASRSLPAGRLLPVKKVKLYHYAKFFSRGHEGLHSWLHIATLEDGSRLALDGGTLEVLRYRAPWLDISVPDHETIAPSLGELLDQVLATH